VRLLPAQRTGRQDKRTDRSGELQSSKDARSVRPAATRRHVY